MSKRRIAVVTASRADLSILLPVVRAFKGHPTLALEVIATGSHLAPGHGESLQHLIEAGFAPACRIPTIEDGADDGAEVGGAIARGIKGFTEYFAGDKPDLLVVLGDRFDMMPAPIAALGFRIPVAHIHGGEVTRGAFDDQIRHAVSKLSHLHFVAAEPFAERLIRMGEQPTRVIVCGAPGLDALAAAADIGRDGLQRATGVPADAPYSLVTVHPETLAALSTDKQIDCFLGAVSEVSGWKVITAPNADPGGALFRDQLTRFAGAAADCLFIEAAGPGLYPSLLRHAIAMVGNSSSGIIEAGFFARPVVDIGARQAGRPVGTNVTNVPWDAAAIAGAWRDALGPDAARRAQAADSVYGRGDAGRVIADTLATVEIGPALTAKDFCDAAQPIAGAA